jgi:hypothetical protein
MRPDFRPVMAHSPAWILGGKLAFVDSTAVSETRVFILGFPANRRRKRWLSPWSALANTVIGNA